MSAAPSASSAAAAIEAAKQSGNVAELMAAIQRVLAEHNVADAKFVLELPPNAAAATAAAVVTGTDTATAAAAQADTKLSPRHAALPSSGAAAPAAPAADAQSVLAGMYSTTPAEAPPAPPKHQSPPPRPRSQSTQRASPPARNNPPSAHASLEQPAAVALPPSTTSTTATAAAAETQLGDTARTLNETARPPAEAPAQKATNKSINPPTTTTTSTTTSSTRTATQAAPPPKTAAKASPRGAPTTGAAASAGAASSSSSSSSPKTVSSRPGDVLGNDEAVAAIADETAAEMRRVSEQLASELALAEQQMARKALLQQFVGRSAILDDRQRREALQQQQQQPQQASTARLSTSSNPAMSASTARPGKVNGSNPSSPSATAGGAAAETGVSPTSTPHCVGQPAAATTAVSPGASAVTGNGPVTPKSLLALPPSASEQTARRSAVRRTPPLPPQSFPTGAPAAGRTSLMSGSSSLPSLVSAKKPSVPFRTPLFNHVTKEGSRPTEQSGGGVKTSQHSSPNGSTTLPAATGDAAAAKPGSGNASTSHNSASHPRPSYTGSVSVLADDRAVPSPVRTPLLGSAAAAAAAEASRKQGPLTQPNTPSATPEASKAAAEADGAGEGGVLPKLWAEQSKENARRAAELLGKTRLSESIEAGPLRTPPATSPTATAAETSATPRPQSPAVQVAPRNGTGAAPSSASASYLHLSMQSPNSPSRPTTSAATMHVSGGGRQTLREMLQEQQRQQDANRRGLEEHNRIMQAAKAAVAGAPHQVSATSPAAGAAAKPPATLPHGSANLFKASLNGSQAARTLELSSSSTKGGGAEPLSATPELAAKAPLKSDMMSSMQSTSSAAPSSHGSAIQVMKITLPQDEEARQAAVQQLSRTSAGNQHLNSKDRYRALLAAQQSELSAQEKKSQGYKELLSRAVEYNQLQHKAKPS